MVWKGTSYKLLSSKMLVLLEGLDGLFIDVAFVVMCNSKCVLDLGRLGKKPCYMLTLKVLCRCPPWVVRMGLHSKWNSKLNGLRQAVVMLNDALV